MKYIILIPAYEPDEKLLKLVSKINKQYETIIVNDGSGENYKFMFDMCMQYAHVLSYETNMGKGYALKHGYKYIDNNFKDYVVVSMDADGQHDLDDAIKLCDYAKEHKDTLVIGRRHWDETTPRRSRFGNSITRKVFKKLTGLEIYDTQSGLRAFHKDLMPFMLNVEGDRYEYEMNTLLSLKDKNVKFKELNIKTIYIDNNKSSHFRAIKDSYKIYKDIYKWKKANKH